MRKKQQMALPPPNSEITVLNHQLVETVVQASKNNFRKRIIQPLHKTDNSTLHRMLNAMQPGSYFKPHNHLAENKSEAFIVITGALRVILFEKDGSIQNFYDLKAGSETFGIDIEPSVYHTLCVLEPDTVIFEVKPGPYSRLTDKAFAQWAPEENTNEAEIYLKTLEQLGN